MSGSTLNHSQLFSLYSHLCIDVSIELPIDTRYIWTGCRQCLRAIRGAPETDDWVNSEIYSKAVIDRVCKCTWRRKSSVFGDTLGGRDQVNLEMHSQIMIEGV